MNDRIKYFFHTAIDELVFVAARQQVEDNFVNAVAVIVSQRSRRVVPAVDGATENGHTAHDQLLAHVNLKGDRDRADHFTRTVFAALAETRADHRVARYFRQKTVIEIIWVGARQTSNIFFARPVATRTVGEGVVTAESSFNFNCDGVNAVTVVVGHLVVARVSEVSTSSEVYTCRINVFQFHVEVEGHGEQAVVSAATAIRTLAGRAGVVAHHVQGHGLCSGGQCPVGEAVNGAGARITFSEFLLVAPPVQRELVLVGHLFIKLDGELVDAVCVVVGHLSARTAPAVEAAVQVDRTVAVRVIRHIHAEGHSRCRWGRLARAVF